MKTKRKIFLEDGTCFVGTGFGSLEDKKAEIVFNTSMVGYQEILSDPSYTGQAVVMTYPLIGNYGMCADDYETDRPSMTAMIVREYCDKPSNFRCEKTLGQVMEECNIAGVEGIDTRKLTRHIREIGSCKAYITGEACSAKEAMEVLQNWTPDPQVVSTVSTENIYEFAPSGEEGTFHVVVIDCGIKKNILREMKKRGLKLTVVPYNTTAETIRSLKPDGIFISNGPGDPSDVKETIAAIRDLHGFCPIFGICLGHQIIALSYGAQTYKLKFGHRGGNHPVKRISTGKLEITSQNHSYAVDDASIENTGLVVTHRNLLDQTVEGVMCEKDQIFSVQYHPESAPGPQDSWYLFDEFMDLLKKNGEEVKKNA